MTVAGNAWLIAAGLLALALVPCAAVALRGAAADRLVGLEMATVVESMLLLVLAEVAHQPALLDSGVALAALCFGGGLVFARFLERAP